VIKRILKSFIRRTDSHIIVINSMILYLSITNEMDKYRLDFLQNSWEVALHIPATKPKYPNFFVFILFV